MALKSEELLDQLPFSVCVCDAQGLVRYRNAAALGLLGRPAAETGDPCCGSLRLLHANGVPLPESQYPVAAALRAGSATQRLEVLVEKPDGERMEALAVAVPRLCGDGSPNGAVCVLIELARQPSIGPSARHLAAIVEATDDAVMSLAPDLTISAWNQGAARLFGHAPGAAIGRTLELVVPPERLRGEAEALRRILGQGTSEHFESERIRSDGTMIEVAVTSSPVSGPDGEIVGVSQIVRDVTEARRAMDRQDLIIAEMNHRVKNLLILAGGIVGLGARTTNSVQELAADISQRLAALARAHELTLPRHRYDRTSVENPVWLHALIDTILSPFEDGRPEGSRRVAVTGEDSRIAGGMPLTGLALLLHEFATNAAKHGALAHEAGTVCIHTAVANGRLMLTWREDGGPPVKDSAGQDGFGTKLIDLTVRRQLAADLSREWRREGLVIRLSIGLDRLTSRHS